MKSLFGDNRLADMLRLLRSMQTISVGGIASKLGVSDRTVRNDIKQLNQMLGDCAVVEGTQGKYTLRVFERDQFQKL